MKFKNKHKRRSFFEPIFMGSGKHSERDCKHLVKRLKWGMSLLSGIQQGGVPTEEYNNTRVVNDMRDVIFDISSALGFRILEMKYVD